MKCIGTNFDLRSVIYFNGDPNKTIYVSGTMVFSADDCCDVSFQSEP
jgi:hypothetical protein